jgi:hypothetical protein
VPARLQDDSQLAERVAGLQSLLAPAAEEDSRPPRYAPSEPLPGPLARLVAAAPAVLLDPQAAADQLTTLASLLEVPRGVAAELLTRAPALLAAAPADLEARFRALASSFGVLGSDALDVLLADPLVLLTGQAAQGQGLREGVAAAEHGSRAERDAPEARGLSEFLAAEGADTRTPLPNRYVRARRRRERAEE